MNVSPPARTRLALSAALLVLSVGAAACGNDNSSTSATSSGGSGGSGEGVEVRLGYFPNLTHATALVGLEKNYYADELDQDGATLKPLEFNSGSDTVDALLSGSLDATYIGPSPTLTAYGQDEGAVRVIAGAASGGASLVVQPDITSVEGLAGKTIATPGAGNTQDVAVRYYLHTKGLETKLDGTGDVAILPQDNSITVQTFKQGEIDGAWVPEPYASILQAEGGKVLVDESDLWPDGQFVTTQLLVRTDFLDEHPDLVDDLLAAHVEANDYINGSTDEAKQLVNDKLTELTKSELPADVFDAAWEQITFTNDPLASTLAEDAMHANEINIPAPTDVSGLYDLDPLNALLQDRGEQPVSSS